MKFKLKFGPTDLMELSFVGKYGRMAMRLWKKSDVQPMSYLSCRYIYVLYMTSVRHLLSPFGSTLRHGHYKSLGLLVPAACLHCHRTKCPVLMAFSLSFSFLLFLFFPRPSCKARVRGQGATILQVVRFRFRTPLKIGEVS
jgi:hypothetical protein